MDREEKIIIINATLALTFAFWSGVIWSTQSNIGDTINRHVTMEGHPGLNNDVARHKEALINLSKRIDRVETALERWKDRQ